MFDVDKFKFINDQYGHLVGDKALKFLVNRVKNCLREDDFIGRLGGDEFIVFQKSIQTKVEAESLIIRITNALEAPLKIDDDFFFLCTRNHFKNAKRNSLAPTARKSSTGRLQKWRELRLYRCPSPSAPKI